MNGAETLTQYLPAFFFVFLRASVFLYFFPIFGSRSLPAQFKIGIIIAFSIVLTPVVEVNFVKGDIPLIVVREVLFGLLLGLTARLMFFAVEMAGQIMSNSMGLSIASVFNPDIGQSSEVGRFYGIVTTFIFLALNIHHDLIYIFYNSYEWIPVGGFEIKGILPMIISYGSRLMVLSLKISAPIIIMMLVTNLLLGFIYKAAPQMNIFFISYPIYLFVGLLVMVLCLPAFINVISGRALDIKFDMLRLIEAGRG